MTPSIKTAVVSELCERLQDMLLVALEEEPNNFVALRTTIALLEAFHDREIELDISIFTSKFLDIIYEEVRTYLAK
jgi:hypothetical protein